MTTKNIEDIGLQEIIYDKVQQTVGEMCDNYCKYPAEYAGRENEDDLVDEKCMNCPLCKLM